MQNPVQQNGFLRGKVETGPRIRTRIAVPGRIRFPEAGRQDIENRRLRAVIIQRHESHHSTQMNKKTDMKVGYAFPGVFQKLYGRSEELI